MSGVGYPVKLPQIDKVERQNLNISFNVFGFESNEIVPLCITKQRGRQHHVKLLLLSREDKQHYCLITDLDAGFLGLK